MEDASRHQVEAQCPGLLVASVLAIVLTALPLQHVLLAQTVNSFWCHVARSLSSIPALLWQDHQTSCVDILRALPSLKCWFTHLPLGSIKLQLDSQLGTIDDLNVLGVHDAGHLLHALSLCLPDGANEAALSSVLKLCPKIRHLEISDYDLVGGTETTGIFLRYLPCCLKSLRLRLFPFIDDPVFETCVSTASQLQILELEGLDTITDAGIMSLCKLKELRSLKLLFTRLGDRPQISEGALTAMLFDIGSSSAGHGLEDFEISYNAGPPLVLLDGGNRFVQEVLGKHCRLKRLALSGVVGLGNAAFVGLTHACPSLACLSLFRPGSALTSAGLLEGLTALTGLAELSLAGVGDFMGTIQAATLCPLRRLEMSRYLRSSVQTDMRSTLRLLKACPSLDTVVLRAVFSAEQVESFMDRPEMLNLLKCSKLDEQTYITKLSRDGPTGKSCLSVHLEHCIPEQFFM